MPSIHTLAGTVHLEPPSIKGSRFIGDATTIDSAQAAQAYLRKIRERYAGANHHCFAWRLSGEKQMWRTSDDGEPSGTAGMPILARIDGADLQSVIVVITRYFGGKKLGRGGLIRAYGGTAGLLLEHAEIVSQRICSTRVLTFDYRDQGTIQSVLHMYELHSMNEHFNQRIRLSISVPIEIIDQVSNELRDRTAGRIKIQNEVD